MQDKNDPLGEPTGRPAVKICLVLLEEKSGDGRRTERRKQWRHWGGGASCPGHQPQGGAKNGKKIEEMYKIFRCLAAFSVHTTF